MVSDYEMQTKKNWNLFQNLFRAIIFNKHILGNSIPENITYIQDRIFLYLNEDYTYSAICVLGSNLIGYYS